MSFLMQKGRSMEQNREGGRTYAAIDLKSFYASVECRERGLDPMTTNLVVADASRTEKTICLAVSPALKARGIPGRPRLFEVLQKVERLNRERIHDNGGKPLTGESYDDAALSADPGLAISFVTAPPQMAKYMEISTEIYNIYLKYLAPEDIHVYSIDEVIVDLTEYLGTYGMGAEELVRTMIRDVYDKTGITATGGIGTNMYLAKIAMDIIAKHMPADEYGVRIATLDEAGYRRSLWTHRPLTDFWRVGRGIADKLAKYGIFTMGDIARTSLLDEELFYHLFGVNAEFLIDHAWGWEPCTMEAIKHYKPKASSVGQGQVLHCATAPDEARLILKEMADALSLDLAAKHQVTDQLVLTVCYDRTSLDDPKAAAAYHGEMEQDWYGRVVPRHAHGTERLGSLTASTRLLDEAAVRLYDRIVHPALLVRKLYLTAGHVQKQQEEDCYQLDLFADFGEAGKKKREEAKKRKKEEALQGAVLDLRRKFGKNAVLKGMDLEEGATARDRNEQIGGHRA